MEIQLLRADRTSQKLDAMVNVVKPEVDAGSGNLLCRFVIDADPPSPAAYDADGRLEQTTLAALERAEHLAVSSVGLPPMWVAPPAAAERCARIMLKTAFDFRARARSLQRVVFCLFGQPSYDLFERVRRELEP